MFIRVPWERGRGAGGGGRGAGVAKAAQGDPTKQSQYSRQIRELEGFFGVKLTRLVGKRLEITDEGARLALMIRRQFRELGDFREAMAGRRFGVRFGSQGSIIDWLLAPRLGEVVKALGNVTVELEMLRTLDVARAVADGRLDFGILRADAIAKDVKQWPLGEVGYALFAANSLWKPRDEARGVISKVPMAELLPGGQFGVRWQEWLTAQELRPRVLARLSSFTQLARAVHAGHAAAVLPEMAAVDFDPKKFKWETIAALKPRRMVLIANARSLDRSGIAQDAADKLASLLSM